MKKFVRMVLGKISNMKSPVGDNIFLNNFVEINKNGIETALSDAWKDPSVPQRQYNACTRKQLQDYRNGFPVEPFDALVNILKDNITNFENQKLLEIGCSSGYYSEVLKIKGINVAYYGCDYSESFIKFARNLFPDRADFQAEDACALAYPDKSFDIVVSGCCLLHIMDYKKAIEETTRVVKDYVVFHRTPVLHKKETTYFIKTAYGVRMFEIHFNERELLRLIRENDLKIVDIITFNASFEESIGDFYATKTYLCKKG